VLAVIENADHAVMHEQPALLAPLDRARPDDT
jgi:hypothetical protein